ncbi:MAG: tryptophan synthase subunit alpha [Proteobacteria bacterium]|nr:tryptophan synthase subunit alpha [Pseudomonadota bacterium]
MLDKFIREEIGKKEILLMTHLVLGYPSFEINRELIEGMAKAGVELIELQIPFSEPTADGPTIVAANNESLQKGTKVADCLRFARQVVNDFPAIRFLFMSYFNIPYVFGEERFVNEAAEIGVSGFIIPDLPFEEATNWIKNCQDKDLSNVLIFTPTHKEERLLELGQVSQGFVYCVGRRGVTGIKTEFDDNMKRQIKKYRESTSLPIALGFGVKDKTDINFLVGKSDIAVIGSKLIELQQEHGVDAVGEFLCQIR